MDCRCVASLQRTNGKAVTHVTDEYGEHMDECEVKQVLEQRHFLVAFSLDRDSYTSKHMRFQTVDFDGVSKGHSSAPKTDGGTIGKSLINDELQASKNQRAC